MTKLANKKCVPCQGGIPPLKGAALKRLHEELGSEWKIVESHHLEREFRFDNFVKTLKFINKVGALAERQGHHPDICFGWGYARIKIFTHKPSWITIPI